MATTLRRAFDLLTVLGREEVAASGGCGVGRLAELTGAEKSQVSRTLKALAEYGLVERDPVTRTYRLGWRLYALAARSGDRRLLESAGPLLARLVGAVGERTHLSVLRGTQVLTVLSETPPHAVQAAGWVGRTVPAYCTSSGRALLIDAEHDQLVELFAGQVLEQLGPNAPRDVDEVIARIVAARAKGYAAVDEEFEPGLVGAAAPVRAADGRVMAAISVSGPKFRLGPCLEEAGRHVRACADELSGRLGWGGIAVAAREGATG